MTMFIKLENGQPIGYPLVEQNVRYLFPNIEWPVIITPGFAASMGYGLYEFSQQPMVDRYQKLQEGPPKLKENGIWYQNWVVVSQTDDEKSKTDEEQARNVRLNRQNKLYMTDWTQIPNAELSQQQVQAYAEYRAKLRRITEQPGFPWEIVWPEQPV